MVSNISYLHPYLGKWSNLTNIFQMSWSHQMEDSKTSRGFFFTMMPASQLERFTLTICTSRCPTTGVIDLPFFLGFLEPGGSSYCWMVQNSGANQLIWRIGISRYFTGFLYIPGWWTPDSWTINVVWTVWFSNSHPPTKLTEMARR